MLSAPTLIQAQADVAWQPLPLAPALQPAGPVSDKVSHQPTSIGLTHVGITMGLLALGTLADGPTRDVLQRHRTEGKDDVARIFKDMGEPDIYAPLPLALVATGLITGNDRILRAGGRITGSLMVSGAFVNLLKPLPGRRRPRFAADAYEFTPLSGSFSWPSGHSAMAFALATSVSDEVGFLPVSVALYSAATLTGWSRVNDNRHWVTDVLGGMLVGITSAKVMNGRWRFLGIGGPRFLQERRPAMAEPAGAGMRLRPERRVLGIGNARLLLAPGLAGMQFDF